MRSGVLVLNYGARLSDEEAIRVERSKITRPELSLGKRYITSQGRGGEVDGKATSEGQRRDTMQTLTKSVGSAVAIEGYFIYE